MDRGINMHKEIAMGMKGGENEASGTYPGTSKSDVKLKKGGRVSKDMKDQKKKKKK